MCDSSLGACLIRYQFPLLTTVLLGELLTFCDAFEVRTVGGSRVRRKMWHGSLEQLEIFSLSMWFSK